MNTHTTTTHTDAHEHTRRFSRLLAAGGAAVALTMALNASVASSAAPATAHVDLSGVVAWAVDNDVTGLSPASVRAVSAPAGVQAPAAPAVDMSALREWAIDNGMTGLSPASLRVIGE